MTNPVVNAAAGVGVQLGAEPQPAAAGGAAAQQVGAPVTATSTVTTAALQAEMQRWQPDLQADGVIAHSAAEVFNNHQQELSSRFGLSAQQATEALGGSYFNQRGQRITGPAIVGRRSWGRRSWVPRSWVRRSWGRGSWVRGSWGRAWMRRARTGAHQRLRLHPSAPSAVTSGGSAPVWNPPAVRAPAGGSRVQPAPAAPAAPSAVRRPEHDTVAAPRPRPQPQQQPNWVQQAGQAAWDVLTYPIRWTPSAAPGATRGYLPGIGPAGQREFAH